MDAASGLFDTLNIVLGFSVVMLLLSLVVTALAQATQHTVRLRAKNLRLGLRSLMRFVRPDADAQAMQLKLDALLSQEIVAPTGSGPARWAAWARTKWCTWLTKDEFVALMERDKDPLSDEEKRHVDLWFDRMEKNMAARFAGLMRTISIAWAIAVGAWFQLSTPDLIRQLSTDDALRASLVASAEGVYDRATVTMQAASRYEDVSEQALQQLETSHPDLEALIEEVSGVGEEKRRCAR